MKKKSICVVLAFWVAVLCACGANTQGESDMKTSSNEAIVEENSGTADASSNEAVADSETSNLSNKETTADSEDLSSFATGIKTEDEAEAADTTFVLNDEIENRCPVIYEATRGNVSYGEFTHGTYYSKTCGMERGYSILLPADYSEDKKYPVLYLLHGIFGDEYSFSQDKSNKIREIVGNMAADGNIDETIVVCPNMYATSDPDQKPGFDSKSVLPYDNFINDMMPSAWIMWDAVDVHIDSNNEFDTATRESVERTLSNGDGFWGIAIADHDTQELLLSKKYYAFGQFSRYIRPGYAIIGSSDSTVAAYDPKEGKVVIVAVNTAENDQTWKFNLQDFSEIGSKVTAIRTSGSRADGENWADVTASDDIVVDKATKNVTATLKANSITTYIVEGVVYDSSAESVVAVDDKNIYAAKGTLPVLPETVSVKTSKNNTINAKVTWDLENVDLATASEVTGTLDGYGYEVTYAIKYVDPNMAWYIDCNDNEVGHTSYRTMDSYADLFNEVSDQKYDGTWGRLADYGAYNNSDDDPWAYGWYAYSNQSIDYTVPLEAGNYTLTFGFKEWWNQSRPMSIYAVTDGGETLIGNTNTKNGNNNWNTPVYSYSQEEAGNVTFSVRKNGGPDPVLSFIRIQKNLNLDELKSVLAKAQVMDTSDYSESKSARLHSLFERAQRLMLRAATTQEDVDLLAKEISEFVETDGNVFSEEEIAANDYVLYLVDVASKETTQVPEGYKLGLYQSVTDQEDAVDAGTGLKWGYGTDPSYGVRVNGGASDGTLTGTYAYMSDKGWTYEKGVSGLYYSFELPDRSNNEYLVTIGVKSPWSARDISYDLEGVNVESGLNLGQGSLVERTYNVEVTDGTLNLYAYATNRTSSYVDPLLSYVIVKAVPEYTYETLISAINKYRAEMEGKVYSEKSLAVFEEAVVKAQALIDVKSTDVAAIKKAYKDLEEAFKALAIVVTYSSITGVEGAPLYDNNGILVQAHGGQIQQFTIDGVTKYYWYGEDKTYDYQPVVGVHLYTSTDL